VTIALCDVQRERIRVKKDDGHTMHHEGKEILPFEEATCVVE